MDTSALGGGEHPGAGYVAADGPAGPGDGMGRPSETRAVRSVGRPRQYTDEEERALIFSAAYRALREHGNALTVGNILDEAGVSTRSFYRHFPSKESLLIAMFRRDAQRFSQAIASRLALAPSPVEAVEFWIDEVFGMMRDRRRAERVSVLGLIRALSEKAAAEVADASWLMLEPLVDAIAWGIDEGIFRASDPRVVSDLVGTVTLQAAGIRAGGRELHHSQADVAMFCLSALGIRDAGG